MEVLGLRPRQGRGDAGTGPFRCEAPSSGRPPVGPTLGQQGTHPRSCHSGSPPDPLPSFATSGASRPHRGNDHVVTSYRAPSYGRAPDLLWLLPEPSSARPSRALPEARHRGLMPTPLPLTVPVAVMRPALRVLLDGAAVTTSPRRDPLQTAQIAARPLPATWVPPAPCQAANSNAPWMEACTPKSAAPPAVTPPPASSAYAPAPSSVCALSRRGGARHLTTLGAISAPGSAWWPGPLRHQDAAEEE